MDWLKRNLFLVVSAAVALAAVGGAGFYLYTKIAADQVVEAKLVEKRTELQGLQTTNPSTTQENLAAATEQQKRLLDFLAKARNRFGRFTTNSPVSYAQFGAWLDKNLEDLKQLAAESKVSFPTNNFAFSFTAQKETSQYDGASLVKVLSQLDDVYGICGILFQAKINELISVQRAQVSTNDQTTFGSPNEGDYVKGNWNTNIAPAAVISPYQVTFRCSAAELATVMESLARANNGFNVKWVKVENGEVAPNPDGEPPPTTPTVPRYGMDPRYRGMTPAMMQRYGIMPGMGPRRAPTPQPETAPPPTTMIKRTGPGPVLKERLIKVTLNVDVVKLVAVKP